jgi:hypothetical protein
MLTESQIYTEISKQHDWINNEPMQKQWVILSTNRCEVYEVDNTFRFMGNGWVLPEQFTMEFLLTNDHIERDDCKWKEARFNFESLKLN